MATYVMSDIHGCYDEMQQMLEKIKFSEEDRLIIAGDITDRGRQNREMLEWMLDAPENVEFLLGNHDLDFIDNVDTFRSYLREDPKSNAAYRMAQMENFWGGFDMYKTIKNLINKDRVHPDNLKKYADKLSTFPYVKELNVNGRDFIIVHAAYPNEEKRGQLEKLGPRNVERFYVWTRDNDVVDCGGRPHTTIISGHTPTISEGLFYNEGRVKKIVDEERDCVFYNIDCGCVFRYGKEPYADARLACIRLEDEEIFYV